MQSRLTVSVVGTTLCLSASFAHAQTPWTLELRGGGNVATASFADTDLKAGAGFEATVAYRVAPGLSIYGGWDWQHHRAEEPLFGVTADVEDTGYAYGLRYTAPVMALAKPFVRFGGLYNHVEIEGSDGGLIADSEHTWGWEAGGGLDVALGDSWSLTPGVRYRRFEPTVRFGSVESFTTLSYVTFDVGVAWMF